MPFQALQDVNAWAVGMHTQDRQIAFATVSALGLQPGSIAGRQPVCLKPGHPAQYRTMRIRLLNVQNVCCLQFTVWARRLVDMQQEIYALCAFTVIIQHPRHHRRGSAAALAFAAVLHLKYNATAADYHPSLWSKNKQSANTF